MSQLCILKKPASDQSPFFWKVDPGSYSVSTLSINSTSLKVTLKKTMTGNAASTENPLSGQNDEGCWSERHFYFVQVHVRLAELSINFLLHWKHLKMFELLYIDIILIKLQVILLEILLVG
jgi:hypothetical protein